MNSVSQLNTIKKFVENNEIKKTIFLTPDLDYKEEIKKAINKSKIKVYKHYVYNTEPTKLTKQIEEITNYKIRKQNLARFTKDGFGVLHLVATPLLSGNSEYSL